MCYKLPSNYDPVKRQYQHLCPVCDEDFWGRKNQEYHPAFKIWKNNHKDGLFREAVKEEMVQHKANYKILYLMELKRYLHKPFYLILLEAGGLDLSYAVRQKSHKGNDVYTTCGYRLEIIGKDVNRKVVITKMKKEDE
jgi:hypothetical protein